MRLRVNIRTLKAVAAILAFVLVVIVGLIAINIWDRGRGQDGAVTSDAPLYSDDRGEELVYYNGDWYEPKSKIETVLVIGLDKFQDTAHGSYNNNQQSDFLLLLVMDHQNEKCTAIHLNRDAMTEINVIGATGESASTFKGQLALAHTYGSGGKDSCKNVVKAVSNLLYGIEIDHFISMTMDGVGLLNDIAGGVTLEIMDDFSQIDPDLKPGETMTLTGEQALTYVRARGFLEDSSNLHRMERQRQYLQALQKKLIEQADMDAGFILKTLTVISDYMVSDCTINQLSDLSNNIKEYDVREFQSLPGEAVKGEQYMEFYVDEIALQEMVMDVFYQAYDENSK